MRTIFLLVTATALAAQAPRDLSGAWALSTAPDSIHSIPNMRPPSRQVGLLLGMAGAVPSFSMAQSDTAIVVTNADGFRYVLHPGGDDDRLTILDTLDVRYRAQWDGSHLEVEWRPEGGGRIRERYQLADSGLYLRVDVTVEYERFRRAESRLYRRMHPETP